MEYAVSLLDCLFSGIAGKSGRGRESPEHKRKVQEVVSDIERRGFIPKKEFAIATPFGKKSYRLADVVAIDSFTERVVEIHQIGKTTSKGLPVPREVEAIQDIEMVMGLTVIYHPYDR